jgi:hypothetical protein
MPNTRVSILVVISLLAVVLIFSPSYTRTTGGPSHRTSVECTKAPNAKLSNQYNCCYGDVSSVGALQHWYCADCTKKQDGTFACGAYTEVLPPGGPGLLAPPNSGGSKIPNLPVCPNKGAIPPNCSLMPKF